MRVVSGRMISWSSGHGRLGGDSIHYPVGEL